MTHTNEERMLPIFKYLKELKDNKNFTIDKSGVKTVELINMVACLNPMQPLFNYPGRKTPENYCNKEIDWYLSQDLSVEMIGEHAKIWTKVCSNKGLVNSNYGWCIFNEDNFSQYEHCLKELKANKESRRAMMIYTRPSMQDDYCKDNMSDFICTNNVQCFIRNNKLYYLVYMRSNDAIFGFYPDFYWHCWVYDKLLKDLQAYYPELEASEDGLYWNAGSFHVYERHFDMLEKICTFRA